jgi:hypothetical protein
MILKKYRIGPVGTLKAVYKRTKLQGTPTQDEICALCGVGPEKCKTLIVYSSDNVYYVKKLNYHDLCHGVVKKSVSKYNIIYIYIPWKIR